MTIQELEETANAIRQDVITMLAEAGSGHAAGSLGMADVLAVLYGAILHHQPRRPDWPDRDRLVLSNGHIAPALYATLAQAGYFPKRELLSLRQLGSRLQGHPERTRLPGLETSSGPLGSGLSQAIGMALAARLDGASWRTYCLMSDGEQNEGNTWEAAMLAGRERLDHLIAVVDRNHIQMDGPTEHVMPLEPLGDKYRAFGWHVLEVDGHNHRLLLDAFNTAKTVQAQPALIIAQTVPGRGVSFMERRFAWHGKAPNRAEADAALRELGAFRQPARTSRASR
ncbi:transketolase [Candidatus Berkelbacteria bacterium]|nr:transketolase [Candidatus Berkelbacteria bacterium]